MERNQMGLLIQIRQGSAKSIENDFFFGICTFKQHDNCLLRQCNALLKKNSFIFEIPML